MTLPWLGVLIYLIVRGGSMQQCRYGDAVAQQEAANAYIRSVAEAPRRSPTFWPSSVNCATTA